jgi:hypothetical protein
VETTRNTSKNVKPVTIITENTEEKDDDTENILKKLQELSNIVDLTQKDAQLVLIRENIFQKAANKILQLQKSKTKNTTETQELVEDLRNFAYIIDECRNKANVIMLEGEIFREAADAIETLQELNEEWLNKWTQLINQTK